MEDIFTLENGLLVINKDYVRGIPEFKVILEKDRGSEGDADGRKKFMANKKFMYIYIVASMFSYANKAGYNDKQLHEAGIREAKLESNYKPDQEVKEAIVRYREIQIEMFPTLKIINSILVGLRIGENIITSITTSMEATLVMQEDIIAKKRADNEPIDLAQTMATTNGLMDQLTQILKIAKQVPDSVETIKGLEERLKKEMSGTNISRGGKEIGNRADPKKRKNN